MSHYILTVQLGMTSLSSLWLPPFERSRQRPYFYSETTKESVWDPPSSLTPEQLAALPGSQYLQGAVPPASTATTSSSSSSGTGSNKVRASHLLIKHNQSRRPASWKSPEITRSKQEAIDQLTAFEKRLRQEPEDNLANAFAKLASKESDCSSAREGGDLGQSSGRDAEMCTSLTAFFVRCRLLWTSSDAETFRGRVFRAQGRTNESHQCVVVAENLCYPEAR